MRPRGLRRPLVITAAAMVPVLPGRLAAEQQRAEGGLHWAAVLDIYALPVVSRELTPGSTAGRSAAIAFVHPYPSLAIRRPNCS
jgi:hypothetical protein